MAEHEPTSKATAFTDTFTRHQGSTFIVTVDPIFDEQITEAARFISRVKPEATRAEYVAHLSTIARTAAPPAPEEKIPEDDAEEEEDQEEKEPEPETEETREEKRKVVVELVQSLQGVRLEGTDREFEGFSNLILSLVLSLFVPEQSEFSTLILTLVDVLAINSVRSANPSTPVRYTALATVFNALPLTAASTLKLSILLKLIGYACSNEDFPIIKPVLTRFESWLVEWGFGFGSHGEEEGNAAIADVVKSLSRGKKAEARSILLTHLSSPSAVPGTAVTTSASSTVLASRLIALSLAQPDYFDFSTLCTIPAVATPSVKELGTLLGIFTSGDVGAFDKFVADHATVLEAQELDAGSLGRKLKLLALAELCSERVGDLVTYEEIATALRLGGMGDDGEEVETWVIDAIRAQLISGRLSQSLLSFHVTRAAPRSFTATHWTQLQTRLAGWRVSLDDILDSVSKGVSVDGGAGAGAVEVRREISV